MFALIVTASRNGHSKLESWLSGLHAERPIDLLITGDAPGGDTQAVLWAIDNGVFFVSFGADWDQYGNKAGPIRNGFMVECGQVFRSHGWRVGCAGFPDAQSKGTYNCMDKARWAKISTVDVGCP